MNIKPRTTTRLETENAYTKLLSYYFDYPAEELSLNDLCSILGISKTTANRVVGTLVKLGFLKKEVIGKLWRVSRNINHQFNTTRKIPYHLTLIYESGIINAVYTAVPNARNIILFGSYRKGDDNEDSDIDIAAEVVGDDEPKIIELGTVPRLGYRQKVPVRLHVFSRNKISLNLFANIANGIVLEGFIEARP